MSVYGIVKLDGNIAMVEADFFEQVDGMVHFHRELNSSQLFDLIAAYNIKAIESVTLQREYTEQEILDQVSNH